jgi:penicillin-binding protein A
MTDDRRIRRLGLALLLLFVVLFLQLNRWHVVQSEELANDPRNVRGIVRDFSRPRGAIISADGTVLARSDSVGGSFERLRVYPPETATLFAHITGFFSFTYGGEGVERTYTKELAGRIDRLELDGFADWLLGRTRTANVALTVPVSVQQAARDALGERKGAVVALDPRTGAVLALWSFPSYDPNLLSGHSQRGVQENRERLLADPNKPLLPRAYRERYFPGSTFKIITAAAALGSGLVTPDQPVYPTLRELDLPQTDRNLRNFGGSSCGGNIVQALRVSCNTVFAQMGLDLGGDRLAAGADSFGFNKRPPLDLPAVAASSFPDPADFARNLPALAQSAIGQFDVAATPLQMALAAAGIANGGVIMKPHVMFEVRDDDGEVVEQATPEPWLTAVPPEVATVVRDMMVGVVANGTATRLGIPGIPVAGKTGTAQRGDGTSHAWIVGFAPADSPRVAVAVIIEGQPGASEATGGRVAAPIARAVLQAALDLPAPGTGP